MIVAFSWFIWLYADPLFMYSFYRPSWSLLFCCTYAILAYVRVIHHSALYYHKNYKFNCRRMFSAIRLCTAFVLIMFSIRALDHLSTTCLGPFCNADVAA